MSQNSSSPIDQATTDDTNNMTAAPVHKSRQKPPHYERSDDTRVVVTGMGAITPLGLDVDSSWTKLLNGES
ncbi:beta-ketoacyl synthase N-terminal-like domain-containing protein, partial [Paraburkholderia sp. SIMBA_049]